MTVRTLSAWLDHCRSLHPSEIDLSLERAQQVRDRLGLEFSGAVVIVAGTNGKGSTCALLEATALAAGWRTGLYSKPHLVHFEERCRIGAAPVTADALIPHFDAVERARGDITLSFFEFTTLAIARCLAEARCDLNILEVGLGGRYDAVNAFDADCAVITSIDLDHMEYLGPDRESIGREKAGIMRRERPVVCSDPMPPASVEAGAKLLGADLWQLGRDFRFSGDRQQWAWSGRRRRYSGLAYPALRGANQLQNAAGALAVLEVLGDRLPVSAQAVRQGLATVSLPGRFQVLPGRPTVVLDVAHNPHAAAALAASLDRMGFHPATHVVLGAMRDKDLAGIVTPLVPHATHWHVTSLPPPRGAAAVDLQAVVQASATAAPVTCHDDPVSAFKAARAAADEADRIVVVGSFSTVGPVLAHLGH